MKKTILQILSILFAQGLIAQPGTFDPNFATGNVQSLTSYSSQLIGGMPNHKIISIGNETAITTLNNGTQPNPALQFQNTSSNAVLGSISNTSGSSLTIANVHTPSFSSTFQFDEITDFGKTSNGKIAITGFRRASSSDWNYSAFLGIVDPASGSLVSTFNGGDYVTLSSTGTYLAQELEVQSDDKILLAGVESLNNFFVRRYNTDGTLDATFGNSGSLGTTWFTVYDATLQNITDIKVMSNGKIIISGFDLSASVPQSFVARLNSDGTLDTTFGADGIVEIVFPMGSGQVTSVDVTSTGEVIIVGNAPEGTVMKLTTSGDNSTDFTVFTESNLSLNKVEILPTGKILVAGNSSTGNPPSLATFILLNANGTPDTGFGSSSNGKATFGGGMSYGLWVNDFDIQADGKVIFVAGSSQPYETSLYTGRILMNNSSAGIESEGLNNYLSIYPNPASNVINVEMEIASTVRLFDVSGKLLKEVNGASIYTIDVTDLTPGMYMIESAEGAKAKFIKE
jgi:uncharacterized delta-60 repeat protein